VRERERERERHLITSIEYSRRRQARIRCRIRFYVVINRAKRTSMPFPRVIRSSSKMEHSFRHCWHSDAGANRAPVRDIEFQRSGCPVTQLEPGTYLSTMFFQGLPHTWGSDDPRARSRRDALFSPVFPPHPSGAGSFLPAKVAREFGGCIECPTVLRSRLRCPATPRSFHG